MPYKLIEEHMCFKGKQIIVSHWSSATQTEMQFALFLPPLSNKEKVPALYWLSGLTCTEQNFITKAGAQRVAAYLGMALVVPDTSPRGLNHLPNEDFLGAGASFYLDATMPPWHTHYQMYTYISQDLPRFISAHFPIDSSRCGLAGHSMGGYGALMIGLRNPHLFRSISAFAPICSMIHSKWGLNALEKYLGGNKQSWENYDICAIIKNYGLPHDKILIDQGAADSFLNTELNPHLLSQAAEAAKIELCLRFQPGYDHSYYFVSTFIEDHLIFHHKQLV